MKTLLSRSLACVLFCAGGAAGHAASSVLYGVTFFGNELIRIDPTTGSGSLVTTLSESVSAYGIGFRGAELYTFDPGIDQLRAIDRFTGSVSAGLDIGVGDLTGEGDIAFRADGVGFLSSALSPDFSPTNDLFRFDVLTGTSTRVGTTDVVLDAMAFVDGTLFAIGQEADATLYIVDQDTAALTAVGSLGVAIGSPFAGLTATADGDLYAAINDQLFAVDKATGVAQSLDPTVLDLGFSSVSGLASTTVPETSALWEIPAALVAMGMVMRRMRRSEKPVLQRVRG